MLSLREESGAAGEALRLGVVRTYTTRHGAGPFVTEDPAMATHLPEPHRRLERAQPIYRRARTNWVEEVTTSLAAPVVATSSGPTADDKQWVAGEVTSRRAV